MESAIKDKLMGVLILLFIIAIFFLGSKKCNTLEQALLNTTYLDSKKLQDKLPRLLMIMVDFVKLAEADDAIKDNATVKHIITQIKSENVRTVRDIVEIMVMLAKSEVRTNNTIKAIHQRISEIVCN